MVMMQKIYDKSPVFIQNLMCSGQGWLIKRRRYNKAFYKELDFYLKHKADGVVLLDMFLNGLKDVPAYKDVFANREHVSLSDFPIINKQQVKSHLEDFRNPSYKGNVIEMRTSGTTGSGLIFPYSVEMENKQWAIWWRYRMRLGITMDTWCGWFGGKMVISPSNNKPPYWRINKPGHQVMYSSYHLTMESVYLYYQDIDKRKLSWLHGYPSSIARLSYLMIENGLSLPSVTHITTGAENLLESQIVLISRAFPNAMIRQHYGLSEGVANFSQDKEGVWHTDDDFCYVELLPLSKDQQDLYRVIGTGYSNLAFPLIRYDTGDIARANFKEDGSYEIISFDGRADDYISLPSGVKLGRLDFIFKQIVNIEEAQIHQHSLNDIEIKVVKGPYYSKDDENLLIKESTERFGKDVNVSIKYTDKIQRTKSGKLRLVISDIK